MYHCTYFGIVELFKKNIYFSTDLFDTRFFTGTLFIIYLYIDIFIIYLLFWVLVGKRILKTGFGWLPSSFFVYFYFGILDFWMDVVSPNLVAIYTWIIFVIFRELSWVFFDCLFFKKN